MHLDNSLALLQVLCPAAYGPHNQGYLSILMLLQSRNPDVWKAGVACDGMLVIEGPGGAVKAEALNLLFEAVASKLARCVKKAWTSKKETEDAGSEDGSDAEPETGLEEDAATGARFASERRRRRL
jgi:hypothetical protein